MIVRKTDLPRNTMLSVWNGIVLNPQHILVITLDGALQSETFRSSTDVDFCKKSIMCSYNLTLIIDTAIGQLRYLC